MKATLCLITKFVEIRLQLIVSPVRNHLKAQREVRARCGAGCRLKPATSVLALEPGWGLSRCIRT